MKFEQIFSFVYSPRPLTEAAEFTNKIPKDIAKKRLHKLQKLHGEIIDEISKNQIGKVYKVLVEDMGMGKSDNFFTVKVDENEKILGKIVNVKILEANKHTLKGKVL